MNSKLVEEDLPSISYRISADYGTVELATSATSNSVDIFGPTVNTCAKINGLASSNELVITCRADSSYIQSIHDRDKVSEPKIQPSSILIKIENHLDISSS